MIPRAIISAAANTAVPFLNGHADQSNAVQQALQDSIVTVDLFMVNVNGVDYGPEDDMPAMRAGDRVEVTAVVRNRKSVLQYRIHIFEL